MRQVGISALLTLAACNFQIVKATVEVCKPYLLVYYCMQLFVVSVELAHLTTLSISEVVSAIFKKGARGCAATVSGCMA